MTNAPLLEVAGLAMRTGERCLFAELSFRLEAGEQLSIIGPNGAGKSTLLRCLLGLVPAARPQGESVAGHVARRLFAKSMPHNAKGWTGRVQVKGLDVTRLSSRQRARIMAHVPQGEETLPPFTVEAFVAQGRYAHAEASERTNAAVVDQCLRDIGLWALRERRVAELSGGERQKAFLAAALAQEPELLVLDEPAAYLDPAHEQALHDLLLRLRRERGLGVITVSHNLNRVLLGDGPVLAIANGCGHAFSNANDLLAHNALNELFAARFVTVAHPHSGQSMVLPAADVAYAVNTGTGGVL